MGKTDLNKAYDATAAKNERKNAKAPNAEQYKAQLAKWAQKNLKKGGN